MSNTVSSVTCRPMRAGEADVLSRLILGSFEEFIAPEYSDEGQAEFRRYVEPAALERRNRADHFILVAEIGGRVAGMIEIRQNDHVALLFVDKAFHGQGVARTLLEHGMVAAKARRPDLEHFTVNSSRYGVAAYEKLGFIQTGPERSVNGIVFIPMAKRL